MTPTFWAKDMSSGTSPEKEKAIVKDWLQMVDNPLLSDVILVCEDGVEVHACRMMLAARSLFFRQMLLNGMAESRNTSVSLPTVSSSVLVIIMKFLYAEVLLDEDVRHKKNVHSMSSQRHTTDDGDTMLMPCDDEPKHLTLDWELLLKVLVAVRYLMLEQLEKVIIKRLWNDVLWNYVLEMDHAHMNRNVLNAVACNLSTLCEYSALWNANEVKLTDNVFRPHPVRVETLEAIAFQLLQIIVFNELSAATLFNLSRKAFHFYLSKTQGISSDKTWYWSLEEYLRLREVITWCAVRTADTETAIEDLDRTCLPEPEIALRLLRECIKSSPSDSNSTFDFSVGRERFVEKIVKEDLDQFLRLVDLVSIHPELLVNVIEPLSLIDSLEFSKIYPVQAMRGSRRLRRNGMYDVSHVWHWAGSGLYLLKTPFNNSMTFTVSVEPSDAQELSLVSAAAAELKMEFPRTFEWEIVVTQHGLLGSGVMELLEIGFYRLYRGEDLRMQIGKRGCMRFSEFSRGSVLSVGHGDEVDEFYDRTSWKGSPERVRSSSDDLWNTPIKVTLNRKDGTCSYSFRGEETTYRIDNAEDEIFYPVVFMSWTEYIHEFMDGYFLRPHYDRVTVKIQNLKGFDESVYVNPSSGDQFGI